MKLRSTASFGGRLFLCYLLACFFSFLLYVSLSFFITAFWAQLVLQICCLGVTFMMLYQFSWEQGEFDANHVSRGECTASENRGLTAGLFTLILPVLFFVLGLLAKLSILPDGFFHLQNVLNVPFYSYIGWLFAELQTYTTEAGNGVAWVMCDVADAPLYGFALQLLPMLLMPAVSFLGYKLGRRRILLSDKVMYRTPEKRAEHEQKRLERQHRRNGR